MKNLANSQKATHISGKHDVHKCKIRNDKVDRMRRPILRKRSVVLNETKVNQKNVALVDREILSNDVCIAQKNYKALHVKKNLSYSDSYNNHKNITSMLKKANSFLYKHIRIRSSIWKLNKAVFDDIYYSLSDDSYTENFIPTMSQAYFGKLQNQKMLENIYKKLALQRRKVTRNQKFTISKHERTSYVFKRRLEQWESDIRCKGSLQAEDVSFNKKIKFQNFLVYDDQYPMDKEERFNFYNKNSTSPYDFLFDSKKESFKKSIFESNLFFAEEVMKHRDTFRSFWAHPSSSLFREKLLMLVINFLKRKYGLAECNDSENINKKNGKNKDSKLILSSNDILGLYYNDSSISLKKISEIFSNVMSGDEISFDFSEKNKNSKFFNSKRATLSHLKRTNSMLYYFLREKTKDEKLSGILNKKRIIEDKNYITDDELEYILFKDIKSGKFSKCFGKHRTMLQYSLAELHNKVQDLLFISLLMDPSKIEEIRNLGEKNTKKRNFEMDSEVFSTFESLIFDLKYYFSKNNLEDEEIKIFNKIIYWLTKLTEILSAQEIEHLWNVLRNTFGNVSVGHVVLINFIENYLSSLSSSKKNNPYQFVNVGKDQYIFSRFPKK